MQDEEIIKTITEQAEKTAHIREEIITELKPKVGYARKDFITTVVCCEQNVNNLKELDKLEAKELKTAAGAEFSRVKDYLYYTGGIPKDDSPAKLETLVKNLAVAIKWLNYIGKEHLLERWLNEYGILLRISHPNKYNTFMNARGNDENVQDCIAAAFETACEASSSITEKTEQIKVDSFEELPDEIRYSKENKRGINASQFDNIVTIKALKNIEEEKASKKAAAAADKAMDTIEVNKTIFNIIEPDSLS